MRILVGLLNLLKYWINKESDGFDQIYDLYDTEWKKAGIEIVAELVQNVMQWELLELSGGEAWENN